MQGRFGRGSALLGRPVDGIEGSRSSIDLGADRGRMLLCHAHEGVIRTLRLRKRRAQMICHGKSNRRQAVWRGSS